MKDTLVACSISVAFLVSVETTLWAVGFEFQPWVADQRLFRQSGEEMSTNPNYLDPTYGFPFVQSQRFAEAKPAGTLRVVLLGGSSVYRLEGASRFQMSLEAHLGTSVQIIKWGSRAAELSVCSSPPTRPWSMRPTFSSSIPGTTSS